RPKCGGNPRTGKTRDPVTAARLIRMIFGTIAGIMLILAVGDVVLSGRLTIISPITFAALLAVALAFLISNILNSRERQEMLARQAAEMRAAAQRLENSLRNAATVNSRLYQSEIRYKGLVDAQGD